MKERPILFNSEMVRAILDGRKTQTRRVVKLPLKDNDFTGCEIAGCEINSCLSQGMHLCPYGEPGDRLWVRETWAPAGPEFDDKPACEIKGVQLIYRADDAAGHVVNCWRPSIHMPRWASRLTLEIVNVRVERVRDISEADAKAEGIQSFPLHASNGVSQMWGVSSNQPEHGTSARIGFEILWDSINSPGDYAWDKNPRVWAIEFKRV